MTSSPTRTFNSNGQAITCVDSVIDALMTGNCSIDDIFVHDSQHPEVIKYNDLAWKWDMTLIQMANQDINHSQRINEWKIPKEYLSMDIFSWLIDQCNTDEERERISLEFIEYDSRHMTVLLQLSKYLVDTMREHNIVWGVGRGSSVSSYCLFLIGLHKIDSIKYELDYKEFFK